MPKKRKFLMNISPLLIAVAPILAERNTSIALWHEPQLPSKIKKKD